MESCAWDVLSKDCWVCLDEGVNQGCQSQVFGVEKVRKCVGRRHLLMSKEGSLLDWKSCWHLVAKNENIVDFFPYTFTYALFSTVLSICAWAKCSNSYLFLGRNDLLHHQVQDICCTPITSLFQISVYLASSNICKFHVCYSLELRGQRSLAFLLLLCWICNCFISFQYLERNTGHRSVTIFEGTKNNAPPGIWRSLPDSEAMSRNAWSFKALL